MGVRGANERVAVMRGLVRGVGGLAVAGVAVFAGTQAKDDNTSRDESGAIVESGGLGVFKINDGDCFNNPDPDATEVVSVEGVPCTAPHDGEAYGSFLLVAAEYPGETSVIQQSSEGCLQRFEMYVGLPYAQSRFDFSFLYPTDLTWKAGDREVVCVVTSLDGSRLTGSARGSRA